ncbi:hypothetical protein CUMW_248510 [Citrus unshiu]|uniref:Uncharacterized protein n=1 Tax=Citrus unshiu TaxID=55188 RepID=A0A2H5QP61_CITUN|nr:hypothetical protein CUMW_248510 [Citrus unshiu]
MAWHRSFRWAVPAMTLTITLATMDKEILRTHDLQFCTRPHPTSTTEVILQLLKDLAKWHLHPTMISNVQNFRPLREDEVWRMIEKISKSVITSKLINLSVKTKY